MLRPGGPGAPGGAPTRGPMGGGPPGMSMVPSAERAHDFTASLRRFTDRLRPERAVVVGVFVLGSVSVFFTVLGPKILGNATNVLFDGVVSLRIPAGMTQAQAVEALRAQGQDRQADMVAAMTLTPGQGVDFTALGRLLALAVVLYFVGSLLSWAQNYLMAGVTQRTMYRLREDVDAKLGRLPLRYFDSTPRGDLLSRVTNDIDNISTTLQQTLTQMVTALLTVVGVLAMMVWISPLLALVSVLTVPLSFVATMLISRRSKPHFINQWTWTGKLNSHVEEMFSGHELVRVYGHRDEAIANFDTANEQMYESSFRAQFVSGMIQPALTLVSNLNYVAIAVFGGLRVASGAMSLGDVQAFIQYSRQFTMPITQIAGVANLLQSGAASAERVFELLDAPEQEPDDVDAVPVADPSGRITFENIRFRYREDTPLIDDLSLAVEPGQTIAIVGPTGAGKTTLVNLLMRFYEVQAGRILIDGIDTREATREQVRRCFGMVLQETWLVEGTIHDNIAYGAEWATDDDVRRAATASYADHFIRTLPDGYQTRLTEQGENVSAGERQLLTIARAFLADPAVLILDEATSSVDTRTEVLIQRAMADLRQGRTSFVIAHRLSTIRNADVILVMNRGSIVEQGSHDELMAREGFYFDLYESQFSESPDDVARG
ncbi:MAG: ATP-binding cassette domain-containing protein [Actinobacteria bacterium]|nr:ATP-binding cassette domain-containing protein [Actinomycetota bacterium]MSW40817.1 ATP-binding cassette domain-containing protein [Actinomycetota bacterium]